ncbi:MAG TPA: biotin transporter BioY [Candidatus Limnocylindrales bacterium]|jgi:biotin transport system substrate-specific component|nr:biotin transporter BioY [Candidatus Limnocylindrales bacterium]
MATATSRLARVPPFERGITLGDFLVPIRVGERASSRQRHLLMIVAGTLLIILGARISFYLPDNPLVPVTLQTASVLFGGALLGFRRGLLAVGLYLALGAVGLPVFAWDSDSASYRAGLDTIVGLEGGRIVLGVTGGYLLGFVLAAGLVGRLAELGWDRNLAGAIAALALGNALIYVVGLPWLAVAASLSADDTIRYGLLPFIPGDVLKIALAAGLLPVGWWAVRHRGADR